MSRCLMSHEAKADFDTAAHVKKSDYTLHFLPVQLVERPDQGHMSGKNKQV